MKVRITETNTTAILAIEADGINYASDFVGNHGGLVDGQFVYDDETGDFVCSQETYDWWQDVLEDNQKLQDRIAELADEHGRDAVYAVINDAGNCDLEDHAAIVNEALTEAFGD